MRTKHGTRTRKPPPVDIFDATTIIRLLARAGCAFRVSGRGAFVVSGLGRATPELQRLFLNFEQPSLLVAAAKEYLQCENK